MSLLPKEIKLLSYVWQHWLRFPLQPRECLIPRDSAK